MAHTCNSTFWYLPDKRHTETKRHYVTISYHLQPVYKGICPKYYRAWCSNKTTSSADEERNKHIQKSSGKEIINCTPSTQSLFATKLFIIYFNQFYHFTLTCVLQQPRNEHTKHIYKNDFVTVILSWYTLTFLKPNGIYIYIYMSYRSANFQTLHFKYLFNKYTYWIF